MTSQDRGTRLRAYALKARILEQCFLANRFAKKAAVEPRGTSQTDVRKAQERARKAALVLARYCAQHPYQVQAAAGRVRRSLAPLGIRSPFMAEDAPAVLPVASMYGRVFDLLAQALAERTPPPRIFRVGCVRYAKAVDRPTVSN